MSLLLDVNYSYMECKPILVSIFILVFKFRYYLSLRFFYEMRKWFTSLTVDTKLNESFCKIKPDRTVQQSLVSGVI